MLIAPFAGLVMNVAIASARGDRYLLWRSLLRYFSALAVTILITFLLSVVLQQEIPLGQNTLLSVVYVQRKPGVKVSDAVIRDRITRAVQKRLQEKGFNVTPLVSVNVLEP